VWCACVLSACARGQRPSRLRWLDQSPPTAATIAVATTRSVRLQQRQVRAQRRRTARADCESIGSHRSGKRRKLIASALLERRHGDSMLQRSQSSGSNPRSAASSSAEATQRRRAIREQAGVSSAQLGRRAAAKRAAAATTTAVFIVRLRQRAERRWHIALRQRRSRANQCGDLASGGCQCRYNGARRRVTRPRPARGVASDRRGGHRVQQRSSVMRQLVAHAGTE
jgi:hypothetical protein